VDGGAPQAHSTRLTLRHVFLFKRRFLARETDRGLHDRPLTPPVGGEASQALRSSPEQKRDIDPSEFIHLELVVFSISC
jgi:hypothetical protein